jgi:hypothetical protein
MVVESHRVVSITLELYNMMVVEGRRGVSATLELYNMMVVESHRGVSTTLELYNLLDSIISTTRISTSHNHHSHK